ncbi:class I SAM-dependent methyltransferase [Nocardioides pantholopis]|uniref:class I SAM-dependent methyltransferase n=1 Tax=Nocardioides pantholopis TaxID=2483798 RepID=UPI000F088E4C|nr:class I SAM-dependent methyltransferase [Nocardioides pantholopis]
MSDHSRPDRARSFGAVASAYDRGRPAYPREAAAWLAGERPVSVLELGAGTGKLTGHLVALGHDVHATDPDPAMLDQLARSVPGVRAAAAAAEELPLPDRSVDVVVSAQAYHWFDHERALPEITRVLRPGGHLALVWNFADLRIPWVRRLARILGDEDQREDLIEPLTASAAFAPVDEETFKHWQRVDRDTVQDLALSRSAIATLAEEERAAKLAEVLAFYDDYGRGMDGMQLPYTARCYRARVRDEALAPPRPPEAAAATQTVRGLDEPTPMETTSDGTDTDMLLIDFR